MIFLREGPSHKFIPFLSSRSYCKASAPNPQNLRALFYPEETERFKSLGEQYKLALPVQVRMLRKSLVKILHEYYAKYPELMDHRKGSKIKKSELKAKGNGQPPPHPPREDFYKVITRRMVTFERMDEQ